MDALVSVIMPAYNVGKYISGAIRSTLDQTHSNFELIIVNDGSKDDTLDIISSFSDPRITLINNTHSIGAAQARNIAIDVAKGSYIALTDADDINMPGRFQAQVEFLQSHPEVDVLGTNMYIFSDQGDIIGEFTRPPDHHQLVHYLPQRAPLFHPSVMARAKWFRSYGYRSEIYRVEDRDLFLRSYNKSRFANIPQAFYAYRDPGQQNLRKLILSKFLVMKMLWQHRLEYRVPLHTLLESPLSFAGHITFYILTFILRKSPLSVRMESIKKTDELQQAQEYLHKLLKQDDTGP